MKPNSLPIRFLVFSQETVKIVRMLFDQGRGRLRPETLEGSADRYMGLGSVLQLVIRLIESEPVLRMLPRGKGDGDG